MIPKEKFAQFAKQGTWEKINYNAIECEQIADEFAMNFIEWCAYYQLENVKDDLWISRLLMNVKHYETYTLKELLEKFKKEKGL